MPSKLSRASRQPSPGWRLSLGRRRTPSIEKTLPAKNWKKLLTPRSAICKVVVKQKEEALEGRDSEVNDLKSKRDGLAEQVTQLELAIQQAKGEAASQAQHAEQVIEGLKATITGLEAKLKETEDTAP